MAKSKLLITTNSILESPITRLLYGITWFSLGVIYWQLQILEQLGLVGIFVTGVMLMAGFILIGSNEYEVRKIISKQIHGSVK